MGCTLLIFFKFLKIMKPNNIKLIIVPDVHGRTFWQDVFKFDAEIVFLGDYLVVPQKIHK